MQVYYRHRSTRQFSQFSIRGCNHSKNNNMYITETIVCFRIVYLECTVHRTKVHRKEFLFLRKKRINLSYKILFYANCCSKWVGDSFAPSLYIVERDCVLSQICALDKPFVTSMQPKWCIRIYMCRGPKKIWIVGKISSRPISRSMRSNRADYTDGASASLSTPRSYTDGHNYKSVTSSTI